MSRLRDQLIRDQEIIVSNDDEMLLGPDLVLERCRIILRTGARAMPILNVRFFECRIETKKTLTNYQAWCGCVLENCTLSGRFSGNDFGHWEDNWPGGRIERCDFSNAILDGCRLMDTDMGSIKLPSWPCFTVLNPMERKKDIESIAWPGRLGIWAQCLLEGPIFTSCCIDHAPSLSKQFRITEEELRNALERLGGVIF